MFLITLIYLTECDDPPIVHNSEPRTTNAVRSITSGDIRSKIEYVCNDNYHINDKSKMVISCALGAIWNYTSLPVCLKGKFNMFVSLNTFK